MFSTIASIIFTFLAVIWKKDDWLNTVIKFFLIALAVWGGIEALMSWGFVVAMQS